MNSKWQGFSRGIVTRFDIRYASNEIWCTRIAETLTIAKDDPYRRAEKKIERARVSGATELGISGMKLMSLPESLLELTGLEETSLLANDALWIAREIFGPDKVEVALSESETAADPPSILDYYFSTHVREAWGAVKEVEIVASLRCSH